MARLSSDLTELKEIQPVPEDKYRARVFAITEEESKAKNQQLRVDFKVVGGPYDGREIRNWIIRSGKSKEGKPLVPFRLAQFIDEFHLGWGCDLCASEGRDSEGFPISRIVPFLKGNGENGTEKGQYYCPDCRQPMKISYETNDWIGKEGYIFVSVGKQEGSDRERNSVEGYASL